MAPRNTDENSTYKKKTLAAEIEPENENDVDICSVLPCIWHKKHRVVKLVKSQMQKIQDNKLTERLQDDINGTLHDKPLPEKTHTEEIDLNGVEVEFSREEDNSIKHSIYVLLFLLGLLLLLFVISLISVWASAGPLSSKTLQTPISSSSLVRTDTLCTLEKKSMERWGKPESHE